MFVTQYKCHVRLANRERQRLSRLQKKEIGLATMLLCVVVVFLLCNVWALISNVAEAFYGITVDQLVKVSNLLVTINSSVNFVIYVIFGEKFKRLFFKLFFPRGVWMCGWHGTNGRVGGPAVNDDSEATCNGGATTFECRNLAGVSSDKFLRSHRGTRHHHHGSHNHHGTSAAHKNCGGAVGGGTGPDGCGHRGNGGGGGSKAKNDSGIMWENSTTITTTTCTNNVHA